MEKTRNRIFAVIVTLLTVIVFLIGGNFSLSARADDAGDDADAVSSDVLEDLKKDETFDESKYPVAAKDYFIKVIQIAETNEGGLCIYTYQPSRPILALTVTDINMSLSERADGTKLYPITLLSENGVFAKYIVDDFKISETEKRYYNITSIYREFERYIDTEQYSDNKTKKIAQEVGKLFIAETVDGVPVYYERKTETVDVTDKYAGFIRLGSGYDMGFFNSTAWESNLFYVAFNSDKEIEKLYEADVCYSTKEFQFKIHTKIYEFWNWGKIGQAYDTKIGEAIPHDPVTLRYNSKNVEGKYVWDKIQTVEEFKANLAKNNLELTEDAENGLKGKKWVLNFASETIQANTAHGWINIITGLITELFTDDPTIRTQIIGDVSILRLKFETEEELYNVGVVDDATTGSGKPSTRLPGFDKNNQNFNVDKFFKEMTGVSLKGWIAIIVLAVAAITMIALAAAYPQFAAALGKFFGAIGTGLLYVLQGVWWLICLPFKGIVALAEKNKTKPKKSKSKPKAKKSGGNSKKAKKAAKSEA